MGSSLQAKKMTQVDKWWESRNESRGGRREPEGEVKSVEEIAGGGEVSQVCVLLEKERWASLHPWQSFLLRSVYKQYMCVFVWAVAAVRVVCMTPLPQGRPPLLLFPSSPSADFAVRVFTDAPLAIKQLLLDDPEPKIKTINYHSVMQGV